MDGYNSSSLDSSSMSSGVSSHSSFFSRNSSCQSLDSKNSAYMHLKSQLEESKQHVQLLEQRNQQLARDRDLLSAQVAALQSSSANEADKDLSPDEYKDVNFWTRSKWTLHIQAKKAVAKLGSGATSTQRRSTRLSKGENVACQFIEDASGVPVDGHRAKAAHSVFTAYLHQLNQAGVKLPSSWSQVPLDLKEELSASHVKKPKTEVTAPEDSDLKYMDINIPPNVTSNQSPIVVASPTHDTLNDFIDPALKALSAPSNPNNPTSIQIAIAGTVPETRESEPVVVPATADMPATTGALTGCSEPSSSRTNEEKSSLMIPEVKNPLFASSSSSSLSIPATPSPSTIPATANMTMTTIPATMDTIPTTTDTIPVTTIILTKPKPKAKPHPVKAPTAPKEPNAPSKAKAMHIQKTINARNLCAAAWKAAGNLLGMAKQFKGYWEQLPMAEKAVFEVQAQTLLATNTSAVVTSTTGSGPRGSTEEEFTGSDRDE
ncbi:uncharacterized protein F5891DRAFT_1188567 [Suillus fuscotomentosus]|uniref:Uncharacterized protein n=1 Tax=Suillus fuscotomentosus TaxID=1912939 RepID=A0AAD4HLB1_9AGAM|nr:uncharacterized protein F5891DRAFT_1188567 [Suillus fuscotomentosus]KAG1900657.1 hypothetical protein F5891DRAFT_1188567 [Suillus fuscotomentosus]